MPFGFIQNIGPVQLIICIAVICLLFGAKKIPEIARSIGKAKGEFKKGLAEGERDDEPRKDDAAPKQLTEERQ